MYTKVHALKTGKSFFGYVRWVHTHDCITSRPCILIVEYKRKRTVKYENFYCVKAIRNYSAISNCFKFQLIMVSAIDVVII